MELHAVQILPHMQIGVQFSFFIEVMVNKNMNHHDSILHVLVKLFL